MRENPSEIVKTRDRMGGQKDRSEKNRKRIRERERERDRQRQRDRVTVRKTKKQKRLSITTIRQIRYYVTEEGNGFNGRPLTQR